MDEKMSENNHFFEAEPEKYRITAAKEEDTAWGNEIGFSDVDPRIKSRYLRFLRALNKIILLLILFLCFIICALTLWFSYKSDFEKIIFDDGSGFRCVLDPATGVVKQDAH